MDPRSSLGQVKSLLESRSVINESDNKKRDKFNKKKLSVRMLDVNLLSEYVNKTEKIGGM